MGRGCLQAHGHRETLLEVPRGVLGPGDDSAPKAAPLFFFLPHAPSQQSLVYLKSLKLKVRKALLKGTLAPCVSLSGFCRGVEVVI